jgi:hypothetical protein
MQFMICMILFTLSSPYHAGEEAYFGPFSILGERGESYIQNFMLNVDYKPIFVWIAIKRFYWNETDRDIVQ